MGARRGQGCHRAIVPGFRESLKGSLKCQRPEPLGGFRPPDFIPRNSTHSTPESTRDQSEFTKSISSPRSSFDMALKRSRFARPCPPCHKMASSMVWARATRSPPSGALARRALPQAGAEPGLTEESPAFAARVEEPLEGGPTPFGLGRAAEDVRPGCVKGVLEVWRQASGCWRP
ncbi:hypothetical protein DB31_0353 [Hyalangium minutum]|uniref:Uncharacterized protein n=1 Tax=Hyalangium minutum TaxID=394096 RepID=A0A085WWM9_9BACT|nr:hypothetical protein DB31_0353 [Hyalangium minutum]